MTIKNLDNLALPNQTVIDNSVDAGFSKVQAVNSRLYLDGNNIAFKDEFISAEETNPIYTYLNDELIRIDYASGNYKLFTYVSGNLTQLDYVKGSTTYRKVFSYDVGSNLTSILYSVI